MTPTEATALGVLQGATEFLPVSSSGHLRLAEGYLGGVPDNLALEVALHLGTVLAVILYYRRDLGRLAASLLPGGDTGARRLAGLVVLASVPTALLGLGLKKAGVEGLGTFAVCLGLLVTAGVDFSTLRTRGGERGLDPLRALAIGVAQGLAVLPGVSRSGSTIATGMALGISGIEAARFSFLCSIPAILGATLLTALDLARAGTVALPVPSLLLGIGVSFLVGYACLALLIRQLARGSFWIWGTYCLLLALALLGRGWIGGGGLT